MSNEHIVKCPSNVLTLHYLLLVYAHIIMTFGFSLLNEGPAGVLVLGLLSSLVSFFGPAVHIMEMD